MARIDLIRDAQRPKMNARALFQGPQGSGKTWTMLSVARSLTKGTTGRILGVDTERESMLTYADVFGFKHLPWRPPYSPDELTTTLDQLAANWVESPDDVIIIDSFSHFWMGTGGILDIANGRVQGGWDKARPMQQALVEQILAMPCHILLGARMKNTVLVSDNGRSIENVGLTITQDEALGYELNIVVQLDQQHNIAVMKSRTPAVPVGRMYPGGHESSLAEQYAEWLAGGIPPANREDVEAIVEVFAGIVDAVARRTLKTGFVEAFGMPHSLTADQVPDARAWLAEQGAAIGQGPAAGDEAPAADAPPPAAEDPAPAGDEAPSEESAAAAAARAELAEQQAAHAAQAADGDAPGEGEAPPAAADPAAAPAVDLAAYEAELTAWAEELKGKDLQDELDKEELPATGPVSDRRQRLVLHLVAKAATEAGANPALAPGEEPF